MGLGWRYPPGMTASAYKVTVRKGRETVLSYTGILGDVNELGVRVNGDQIELVYGTTGAPVVLDFAEHPGGELTLERLRQGDGAKPVVKKLDL